MATAMKKAPKAAKKIIKATSKAKVAAAAKAEPKKAEKVIVSTNPYRVGGGYWSSVEALRALGVGKMHAFDAIIPAVIKAMGAEAFKAFKAKDARSDNGKDAHGRIIQNVAVVARADYGKPLTDIGWVVKYDGREKKAGIFKVGK